MSESSKDTKEVLQSEIKKTSMQILSELFSTFDAEPPIIIKKEKKDKKEKKNSDESKKSKKKHKHKDKKHKKKSKKRKKSSSSSGSGSSDESELDLAKLLIKQEKDLVEKRIKIEGTSLTLDLADLKQEIIKRETDLKDKKPSIAELEAKIKREKEAESSRVKKEIKSESESETDSKKHKKKRKHKDKDKKRDRTRSKSRDKKLYKLEELKSKIRNKNRNSSREKSKERDRPKKRSVSRERDRQRDRSASRERKRDRHRDRSMSRDRDRFRDRSLSRDRERTRDRSRDRDFYRKTAYRDTKYERLEKSFRQWGRDDSFYNPRPRSRSRDRSVERDRWSRDTRRRSRSRERVRPSRDDSFSRIDKKKLLEIARKNAIQMMKSGSLPGALTLGAKAQEKVIAAIKSGGKTIEELTDFCKTLSKKEELGELSSSNSEKEDSEPEDGFHHPFQIKDRPTTITMNIKNSVPLPTKTTQERSTELRLQFPVSSGQQHRVTEEWIPVSPPGGKKPAVEVVVKPPKQVAPVAPQPPLPIMPPPPPPPPPVPQEPERPWQETAVVPAYFDTPGPQLVPALVVDKNLDLASVVSQRLAAMKKLHENPNDVQALSQMYKVNQDMQSWAKAQEQFSQMTGAFTGSTGAQIMSQAELNSGYQAWAKKGQLTNAAPVSGGMGMHLLQKMGWKPGEGLGKEKSGTLEPLLLEVKTDKRGLVATEEQKGKNKKKAGIKAVVKTLEGKHPVSLLAEFAQKRKMGAPQYILEFEAGPDHKKNFLFKVLLNGAEYKPNCASINKKDAKAHAATVALKKLGLLA